MKQIPETLALANFQTQRLKDECVFYIGSLPVHLVVDSEKFET